MNSKTGFKVPNSFIIVFMLMVLVAALTYIIPAGKYEFVKGTKIIDPNTFHFVASRSTTLWGFINSVFGGMKRSGPIILFTFLVGGYFYVLIETKAFDRLIGFLVKKLGGRELVIIPLMMIVMSILGAVGIMANPVVAVVPVGLILAKSLHLDQICALALTYCAAYTGYSMSPMCAMTVQTAQKIADVPLMSGFAFRTFGWLVLLAITILYVMRYAAKILKNPEASVMGDEFVIEDQKVEIDDNFGIRDFLVLAGLAVGLAVYTYGSFAFKWGLDHMAATFLLIAVWGALVSGMGAEGFVKNLVAGAQKMAFSALLIGLATSISVILTEGNILHSLIYYVAAGMSKLPEVLIGPVMFYANIIFNFFVSSGSGQAAVVMPIMAPLSDVVGISRQMAICAFQYGDGLSNSIFPTNGVMIASVAVAGVRFDKWLKWMVPLFGIWTLVATILVIIGCAIGVN
ncbi:MAG: hypothetical protein Q4D21_01450 [Phascolarctobacterium sp.]|nr:hypothetical protein [Phascolarctobacterium sp.]